MELMVYFYFNYALFKVHPTWKFRENLKTIYYPMGILLGPFIVLLFKVLFA